MVSIDYPFLFFVFLFFLCIGSFLNVVAWRIVQGKNLYSRSACTQCQSTIACHDLIPVVSWIMLRGKCRSCKAHISILYPCIELLSALLLTTMVIFVEPLYWMGYGIFLCALIITIRTDIETMLIARITSLYLVPVGWLLNYAGLLPLNLSESIIASIIGYAALWSFATLFYQLRKIQGMGEGDFELLACIGAFTGLPGIWSAITIGSLAGSLYGMILILFHKTANPKIPFGPFLALGAIAYLYFQNYFIF